MNSRRNSGPFLLRGGLCANALFLFAKFRSESVTQVGSFENPANFDLFAVAEGRALQPFDRFFHRTDLPEPEAGDEFFCFGEGAIDHSGLLAAAGEANALALRAWRETFGGQHNAGLYELLVEFAHFGEKLLTGQNACFGILAGLHENHHSHCFLLESNWEPGFGLRYRLNQPPWRRRFRRMKIDTNGLKFLGGVSLLSSFPSRPTPAGHKSQGRAAHCALEA